MDPSTYLPTIDVGHLEDVADYTGDKHSDDQQTTTFPTQSQSSPPAPFPDLDPDLCWHYSPAFDHESDLHAQPEPLDLPPPAGEDGGVPVHVVWRGRKQHQGDDEEARMAEVNANALRCAKALFGHCVAGRLDGVPKIEEESKYAIPTTDSHGDLDDSDV